MDKKGKILNKFSGLSKINHPTRLCNKKGEIYWSCVHMSLYINVAIYRKTIILKNNVFTYFSYTILYPECYISQQLNLE